MSARYIPETGTKVIPERIEEKTITGILNPLPKGTRVRATLGGSVLVGVVQARPSEYAIIELRVDQVERNLSTAHMLDVTLWVENGWEFEILEAVES